MGIVAGRARGLVVHDVLAMKFETLIREDALATMTLVTQRIRRGSFRAEIRQRQLPFQERNVRRTVRAVRAASAGLRSLVVVVAVRAIHQARGRPGRDQTWHMRIFAGTHDWMERLIRRTEFHARVRLRRLTIDQRPTALNAVRVAAKTKFILARHRFYQRA